MNNIMDKFTGDWQAIPAERRAMYVLSMAVLIIFAAYKFAYIPLTMQAEADKAAASAAQQQVLLYEKFAASDGKKILFLQQQKLQRLEKQLPVKIDLNQMAEKCYALAQVNDVTMQSLKLPDAAKQVGKAEAKALVGSLDLQMQFKGSYHNVLRFIYRLEKQANLMELADVDIKAAEDGAVEASAVLRVYVLWQGGRDKAE